MRSPARRLTVFIFAVLVALTAAASPAAARSHSHSRLSARLPAFLHFTPQPKYAAIVIDAKTGEVLFQEAPDDHRYPASITKIMTMYLAFEALKEGRLSLSDRLVVSPHAAAMAPSKLGLRQGQTIAVADAMSAIAVKSANDMAVALAERLGGTESHFAEMMTVKAKQLGMNNTQFVNASGLPDNRQLTTARDIAILSRAVLRDFPQDYAFFGKREFVWRGQTIANHNHLLGAMPGVDGIKTGFTSASGFNLAASAVRDNRRLIAVVMGGSSTAARDNHVQDLLEAGFTVLRKRELGQTTTIAQNLREPPPIGVLDRPPVEEGDGEQAGVHILVDGKAPAPVSAAAEAATPACLRAHRGRRHAHCVVVAAAPAPKAGPPAKPEPVPGPTLAAANPPLPKPQVAPAQMAQIRAEATKATPAKAPERQAAAAKGGWAVQLGAYKTPGLARDQLARMYKAFAKALAPSQGRVEQASGTYRVRFAGLSANQAKDACASIMARGQDCMMLRQ
jgi:D-alanyl-D-alanine carboxypeptidase (penicillin-binding protein 5/6)